MPPKPAPVQTFPYGFAARGTAQVQVLVHEPVDLAIVSDAVAVDLTRSSFLRLTLTGDAAISNPSGKQEGAEFYVAITQDATGGRALTWGSDYDWGPGGAPTFTDDAAASVSLVKGFVVSDTLIMMSVVRGEGAAAEVFNNITMGDLTCDDIVCDDVSCDALSAGATTVTSLNAVQFLTGTADPTAGGGVAHTLHALYFRDNAGTLTLWYATGAGATAWAAVDPLD